MAGLSRKKDFGSKKKPYPSVKSKDFAGKKRSYPIPTKADAVDALRLAGLHGRSDIRAKVFDRYPGLKKTNNKALGGILGSAAQGAGSGLLAGTAGGPIGVGTGAIIGGIMGLTKGIFQSRAEDAQAKTMKEQERALALSAKQQQLSGLVSGGGKLRTTAGAEVNPFALALGGEAPNGLFEPSTSLERFETEGTHEENPLGGLRIGKDENGVPNTVEEDETAYNINGKRFVYSNRIPFVNRGEFPKFMKEGSYADASKALDDAFKGRFDTDALNTKKELFERLAIKQETVKELQENPGLSSPEEAQAQNQLFHGGVPHDDPFSGEEFLSNINRAEQRTDAGLSGFNPLDVPTRVSDSPGFLERNQENIAMGAVGAGALTQLGGVFSNIRARKRLQAPEDVIAQTADVSGIKANLVNRQAILRNINRSQQSAIGALSSRAAGSFGAFASNVAGVQGSTAKGISDAMLQSEQLDAAELARVQQLRLGASQFNARARMQADVATAQNKAAFETQRNLYTQGIAANLGSLGQSLINYGIGTTAGKYQGMGDVLGSFVNQRRRTR